VRAIFIATEAGAAVASLAAVEAVAGRGLAGDRYALGRGFYSNRPEPGRHITLIAAEALAELERASGIRLRPGEHRRNLVTSGVDLESLIGRELQVGGVRLYGVKPCVPCVHIEELTGHKGLLDALVGLGGLRTEIVTGGRIRVGDPIRSDP
jgi:MOSC domain-containing protein YiiM